MIRKLEKSTTGRLDFRTKKKSCRCFVVRKSSRPVVAGFVVNKTFEPSSELKGGLLYYIESGWKIYSPENNKLVLFGTTSFMTHIENAKFWTCREKESETPFFEAAPEKKLVQLNLGEYEFQLKISKDIDERDAFHAIANIIKHIVQ